MSSATGTLLSTSRWTQLSDDAEEGEDGKGVQGQAAELRA